MGPRQQQPYAPMDHTDRIERLEDFDRDMASQLAAQTVVISALGDKVSEGFRKITERLDQIGATLNTHGGQLQSLGEARSRFGSVFKWAAGIVAAVAAGALMVRLGLR